jgi:hypothetical protein
MGQGHEADEELAVGAVGIVGPGHGDGSAPMRLGRNSAGSVRPEPPVPVPVGSPDWATKPAITRWKTMPSKKPARASSFMRATVLGATCGSNSITTRPSCNSR